MVSFNDTSPTLNLPALMDSDLTRVFNLAEQIASVREFSNAVRRSSNAKFYKIPGYNEGGSGRDSSHGSLPQRGCGLAWSTLPALGAGDRRFKSGQPHHRFVH